MSKEDQIVDSINSFSIKLFKSLADKDNIIISPLSVAMVLYPLWEGAGGSTKSQMEETLELGPIKSGLKQCIKNLIESFNNSNTNIQLKLANAIWINITNNSSPSQAFLTDAKSYYKNKINEIYFDSSGVPVINNWVNIQTNGKIQNILSSLNPNEVMVLINAIYFKGDWTNEFDPDDTDDRTFYFADGTEEQRPFMEHMEEYAYFENDQVQVVKMPYGDEGYPEAFMYVILPSENSSLDALCKNLNYNNLDEWLSKLSPRRVHLKLPKFTAESDINLKDILSQWMPDAFNSDNADFLKANINACIGRILQKAFIEVNEKGSEAAAVTAATMVTRGGSLEIPVLELAVMNVNRPFIYMIQHVSGVILFTGQVTDPQS